MVRRRSHTIVTLMILLLRLIIIIIILFAGGGCPELLLFFISRRHRLLDCGDDLGHFQGDVRVGCLMVLLVGAAMLFEGEARSGCFVTHRGREHSSGGISEFRLLRGQVAAASLVVDFS